MAARELERIAADIADIDSRSDTSAWIGILERLRGLTSREDVVIINKPVSFKNHSERREMVSGFTDETREHIERDNYTVEDWRSLARVTQGTIALVCSTDNLVLEQTALARGLRAADLSEEEREDRMEDAKKRWSEDGQRYGRWHCVAVVIWDEALWVYDPDFQRHQIREEDWDDGAEAEAEAEASGARSMRIRAYPSIANVRALWSLCRNPRRRTFKISKVYVCGGSQPSNMECVKRSMERIHDAVAKIVAGEDWRPFKDDGNEWAELRL